MPCSFCVCIFANLRANCVNLDARHSSEISKRTLFRTSDGIECTLQQPGAIDNRNVDREDRLFEETREMISAEGECVSESPSSLHTTSRLFASRCLYAVRRLLIAGDGIGRPALSSSAAVLRQHSTGRERDDHTEIRRSGPFRAPCNVHFEFNFHIRRRSGACDVCVLPRVRLFSATLD
ncbi:peptide ABC transporter [Anopheles sinensis]|uniref:Peptide ABC transporter n=1 Tax=Anopheles sinensis TaxID=74873 RepID=A0A084WNS8_ANOSI|nr:peptide ABC transporter [Anopheles sinensis]